MFEVMNWPLGTPGTQRSVVCEPTETGHHFILRRSLREFAPVNVKTR